MEYNDKTKGGMPSAIRSFTKGFINPMYIGIAAVVVTLCFVAYNYWTAESENKFDLNWVFPFTITSTIGYSLYMGAYGMHKMWMMQAGVLLALLGTCALAWYFGDKLNPKKIKQMLDERKSKKDSLIEKAEKAAENIVEESVEAVEEKGFFASLSSTKIAVAFATLAGAIGAGIYAFKNDLFGKKDSSENNEDDEDKNLNIA